MPLVFSVVLISAVAAGLWSAANTTTEGSAAPQNLAALRLAETVTGPEAIAQISKLHGKDVGITDGYIAHYEGAQGGAVLYMGEVASEKDAVELLRRMQERIGAGNQYFTDLKSVTVDGTKLFSVKSGRENHYFWQVRSKVLWIGFDRDNPAALAATVQWFR